MSSNDKEIPLTLVFINAAITILFLALASVANYFLLSRDDKACKSKLYKKAQVKSFNSARNQPLTAPAGGAFLLTKKPSAQSMPRFTACSSTAPLSSPPPSPVAMNSGTPLLKPSGRTYSGSGASANARIRANSDAATPTGEPIVGSDGLGSSSNVPLGGGPSTVVEGRRFIYHFVPTDSDDDSSDDDVLQQDFARFSTGNAFQRADSFTAAGGGGGMTRGNGLRNLFKSRTSMFTDERSFFFIAVIVCSLAEAVTTLFFTFADVSTAAINDESRGTQDVITAPQACSLFVVFVSLLHILHTILEQLVATYDIRKARLRLGLGIAAVVVPYVVGSALTLAGISEKANEYVSAGLEIILAVAFGWTAWSLSERIRSFGQSTEQTAIKVRRVCILVSVSLLIRCVVVFPSLQDEYEGLGAYASVVLLVDIIPLAASVLFLHSR